LNEIPGNNPVYGHGRVSDFQAAKETFPCAWVNCLVTKVEEEMRGVMENENGTESTAVFYDHPCREKVYDSYCLGALESLCRHDKSTRDAHGV
jgi:hypothetical protein